MRYIALEITEILVTHAPPLLSSPVLVAIAQQMFSSGDDATTVWPTHTSQYYFVMPRPFTHLLPVRTLSTRRTSIRISAAWHCAVIRLSGRIWGEFKRHTIPSPKRRSTLLPDLPEHLSHLLDSF